MKERGGRTLGGASSRVECDAAWYVPLDRRAAPGVFMADVCLLPGDGSNCERPVSMSERRGRLCSQLFSYRSRLPVVTAELRLSGRWEVGRRQAVGVSGRCLLERIRSDLVAVKSDLVIFYVRLCYRRTWGCDDALGTCSVSVPRFR